MAIRTVRKALRLELRVGARTKDVIQLEIWGVAGVDKEQGAAGRWPRQSSQGAGGARAA